MVFEKDHVTEAGIPAQIDESAPICDQDVGDFRGRKVGETPVMIGGLDDDFMGAYAVHNVIKTVAAAIEVPFDAQCWVFVGNHPDAPVGCSWRDLKAGWQIFPPVFYLHCRNRKGSW